MSDVLNPPRRTNEIDLIRCWAIFFMMYAHYRIDSLVGFSSVIHLDSAIYQTLHFGLSRTSSAFLGIVSGYFVYEQIRRYDFVLTLQKRFKTLVVPAIYWSVIFLIVTSFAHLLVNRELPPDLTEGFWRPLNKVMAIQYWPANFPLHYLTDLFKLCLIAPLMIFVADRLSARGKVVFIILLMLIPSSVSDPGNSESILPRWDLIVFFVVGLALASEKLDLSSLLRRRISPMLLLVSAASILAIAPFWEAMMQSENLARQYAGYLMIMFIKTAGIILFSGAAQYCASSSIIAGITPDRETVFRAFCLHAIILYFLARVASKMDREFSTDTSMAFAAFLLFPFLAFICAAGLKKSSELIFVLFDIRTKV